MLLSFQNRACATEQQKPGNVGAMAIRRLITHKSFQMEEEEIWTDTAIWSGVVKPVLHFPNRKLLLCYLASELHYLHQQIDTPRLNVF